MTDQTYADAPPIGQPIDLGGPWVPPVSENAVGPNNVVMGQPEVFGNPVEAEGFHQWANRWMARVAPEVQRKAAEYGSNSLAKKGYRFAAAQQRDVSGSEALQLGALQYVAEKSDRIEDALLRGNAPSDDTLVDAAVYLLMVMFIRENGHWL